MFRFLSQRRLFFVLLSATTLLGAGTVFIPEAQAQVPAECEHIGSNQYLCKGPLPESKAGMVLFDTVRFEGDEPHKRCVKEGGGALLVYNLHGGGEYGAFCAGATTPRALQITGGENDGQWIHIVTGALLTKEEADAINPVDCGFFEWDCAIANLFKNLGVSLANSLINRVLGSFAAVLGLAFNAIAGLLSWATTQLIEIPVLPGDNRTPDFITQGWQISRDLVNIIFLILLAFIGLATILGRQTYGLKQVLPSLLLVALLVNFSGVLVAFVVDIANLITNFFLGAARQVATGDSFWSISFPGARDASDLTANLSYHLARIVFFSVAGSVYFLVVLVFFVRVFALWILTILAPFAFAAYILPNTRGMTTMWWKTLIQWAVVGIPMSFFLFLSALVLKGGAAPDFLGDAGALATFMAPITALVILFSGLALSISSAPGAAQQAINYGKQARTKSLQALRHQTTDRFLAGQKAKEDRARGSSLLGRVQTRVGGFGKVTEKDQGAGVRKWAKRRTKNVMRGVSAPVRLGVATATRKGIQHGAAVQKRMDAFKNESASIAKDETLVRARAGEMMRYKDDPKLAGLALATAEAKGGKVGKWFTPEQLRRALQHLMNTNPSKVKDIVKHVPELATKAGATEMWGEKGGKIARNLQGVINPDGIEKDEKTGEYKDKDVQHFATEDEYVMKQRASMETDEEKDAYLEEFTAQRKLANALSTPDIENLDADKIAQNEMLQHELAKKTSGFLRNLFEEMGQNVASAMQTHMEEAAKKAMPAASPKDQLKYIADVAPTLAGMPYTTGGEHLMREWVGLEEREYTTRRAEMKELIRAVQREKRPGPAQPPPQQPPKRTQEPPSSGPT